MYKFIITATSPEAQSIEKVNDLDLAIQIFHSSATCGLFPHVDLVDGQTGEVHAHTCGEGEDWYLSETLKEYMVTGIAMATMFEVLGDLFTQPDPDENTASDMVLRMIAEMGGLSS